jgi:hypothetical protein
MPSVDLGSGHLWATTQGLGMQPLNQLTELAHHEVMLGSTPRFGDVVRDLVSDPAWQVHGSIRT